MENNLIVTPEQAVRRIISSVPKYVQRNNSVDNLSDNDNDDFPFMTPELKAKMEADDTECEKALKEELERKVLYGEFGDGLSDLFILTGNIETL